MWCFTNDGSYSLQQIYDLFYIPVCKYGSYKPHDLNITLFLVKVKKLKRAFDCRMNLSQKLNYHYKAFDKSQISPDPLQFLHLYEEEGDIEVMGFIASVFAYG